MTTLSILPSAQPSSAHAWCTENLSKLTRRFPRRHRDDAVARHLLQRARQP